MGKCCTRAGFSGISYSCLKEAQEERAGREGRRAKGRLERRGGWSVGEQQEEKNVPWIYAVRFYKRQRLTSQLGASLPPQTLPCVRTGFIACPLWGGSLLPSATPMQIFS